MNLRLDDLSERPSISYWGESQPDFDGVWYYSDIDYVEEQRLKLQKRRPIHASILGSINMSKCYIHIINISGHVNNYAKIRDYLMKLRSLPRNLEQVIVINGSKTYFTRHSNGRIENFVSADVDSTIFLYPSFMPVVPYLR